MKSVNSKQTSSVKDSASSQATKNGVSLPAVSVIQPKENSEVAQLLSIHTLGDEANPTYDFTIDKADMKNGSGTSQGTRDYVNSWANVPGTVNYSYEIYDTKNSDTLVDADTGSAPNPAPMKVGQRWDAGHSLGNQNGGKGDIDGWVFPQNPQFNRGNSYNGQKTYKDWRYCENVFHNSVDEYGKGRWTVWLT